MHFKILFLTIIPLENNNAENSQCKIGSLRRQWWMMTDKRHQSDICVCVCEYAYMCACIRTYECHNNTHYILLYFLIEHT